MSLNKTFEAGQFNLFVREDGIIHITLEERSAEISVNDVTELTKVLGKIGGGEKCKVIAEIKPLNTMSTEAKKYSATEESQRYTLANAIVVHSSISRIAANLYLKINPTKTPTKLFNSVDEAVHWLNGK